MEEVGDHKYKIDIDLHFKHEQKWDWICDRVLGNFAFHESLRNCGYTWVITLYLLVGRTGRHWRALTSETITPGPFRNTGSIHFRSRGKLTGVVCVLKWQLFRGIASVDRGMEEGVLVSPWLNAPGQPKLNLGLVTMMEPKKIPAGALALRVPFVRLRASVVRFNVDRWEMPPGQFRINTPKYIQYKVRTQLGQFGRITLKFSSYVR